LVSPASVNYFSEWQGDILSRGDAIVAFESMSQYNRHKNPRITVKRLRAFRDAGFLY
jgi:hypothetical protein